MSRTHDVISAFLDDEPFDGNELAAALSDPEGRELLLDLVALRHLAQPDARTPVLVASPRRSVFRGAVAAAAVIAAMAGGYIVGQRQDRAGASAAPAATRVVEAQSAWQDVPVGRTR